MKRITLFVLSALSVLLSPRLTAQWTDNPNVNTPVAKPAFSTSYIFTYGGPMLSDGAGGFITVWQQAPYLNGETDIHAQRFNSAGLPQWGPAGVVICTAVNFQVAPVVADDGVGGAVIAWEDHRNSFTTGVDLYAQRVNSAGATQWAANGVAICTVTGDQFYPSIVGVGSGGSIIAWRDQRNVAPQIYAQRVNASGSAQWTSDGIAMTLPSSLQTSPELIADGAGGAIVTFQSNTDIVAQRVTGAGSLLWGIDGSPICTAPDYQTSPVIVGDDSGGAIIGWNDNRYLLGDLYTQKVNSSGVTQWVADGKSVCEATGEQGGIQILKDGSGGVIFTWVDLRNLSFWEVYAQKLNASGVAQWTFNGVKVSAGSGGGTDPMLASDGHGGAIICWKDDYLANIDIFAARIDMHGTLVWNPVNIGVGTAANDQFFPSILADGVGGTFLTWNDNRSGTSDIYAQRIAPNGLLGDGRPAIQAVNDVKNDQGGKMSLLWSRSPYDVFGDNTIGGYMALRGIKPSALPAGAQIATFDETTDPKAKSVSSAIAKYFLLPGVSALTDTLYWEVLGTVSPLQQDGYAYTATSLADSGPQGNSLQYFAVWAYTSGPPYGYWYSNIDSGYSVDNLAPLPPGGLMAAVQAGPQVKLTWDSPTDPDVKSYTVYRSASSGFTPAPGNTIGTSGSTSFIDASPPPASVLYYRIIATDVHNNVSLPSAEAVAQVPTTGLYSMQDKWNMVSVPLIVSDYQKTVVFPTATTGAYTFENGYFGYAVLENGRGYWIKFSGAQAVSMTGLGRTSDTVNVSSGWNMVGSLSMSIPASSIGSIPGGIVTGSFFGYEGAYQASATLEPGKGYWVKVSQAGQLVMTGAGAVPASNRIRIEDTGDLPPPPPDELDGATPGAYALDQNYPNPFNPMTSIRYAVASTGQVTLTVFNMIGQEVATLVNEVQDAGYKTVSFDASSFPSGVYTYRITAGAFTDVKKMLLIK